MKERIIDLITDKISGEWGIEPISGEGVKVIRTANFTNLGIIDYEKVVYRDIDIKKVQLKKLRKGDIIIEKSGGSPNQPVGRVVYFDLDTTEDYLCNNFTTILRPDTKKIYPKFLFYLLFIGHTRGLTLKYQNKTTGIINLKLDNYLKEKITIPPLEDQIHISSLLSKAEALIKQRKESFDLLDEYLRSTFLEMFGNPVKNENGWKKVPLKRFGQIITGNTPPRGDIDNFSDNYIEWIKTDNIPIDNLYITKAKEYLSEQGLRKSRYVEKGALLVACIAGSIESVGRASLTDRTVSFNQQINAIQPNEDINSLFLYCLFKNTKSYIQNQASKGMKKILTKGEFEKILMIKPPIELQNQFANIVEKTESLKVQYKSSLSELENLYGSLSQKAFKGEMNIGKIEQLLESEYSSVDNDRFEPKNENHTINIREELDKFNQASLNLDDTKSLWLQTRNLGIFEDYDFTDIEGEAVLMEIFKQKEGGFNFEEFCIFLKNEKIKFNYQQVKEFVFEQLNESKLIQFYASKEWMISGSRMVNQLQDDFAGEGNIWFIVNQSIINR